MEDDWDELGDRLTEWEDVLEVVSDELSEKEPLFVSVPEPVCEPVWEGVDEVETDGEGERDELDELVGVLV